jgi:sorbitol-6-phosphate 2-dehydrogenase
MVTDYAKKRDMKPEDIKPYFESKIPMGRLCTEEDVAKAAIFLASEEASYITGQSINLSGGTIMH